MRLIGMASKLCVEPNEWTIWSSISRRILDEDCPSRSGIPVGKVALVIVDTSAAVFTGNDENSNTETGDQRGVSESCALSPASRRYSPCAIRSKGPKSQEQLLPRGGGAFIAEVDGNFTAWATDRKLTDSLDGQIRNPDFDKITFELQTIDTPRLMDSKGRLIATVMAVPVSDDRIEEVEQKAAIDDKLV